MCGACHHLYVSCILYSLRYSFLFWWYVETHWGTSSSGNNATTSCNVASLSVFNWLPWDEKSLSKHNEIKLRNGDFHMLISLVQRTLYFKLYLYIKGSSKVSDVQIIIYKLFPVMIQNGNTNLEVMSKLIQWQYFISALIWISLKYEFTTGTQSIANNKHTLFYIEL